MRSVHQPDLPRTQRKDCATQKKFLVPQWIIWLFVALALLRGLIYTAIIPPWQSPDEHGHFEYAWLVSQHGPLVGPESISPEFQQRVLASMAQFDYWRLVHQPTPKPLPSSLTDPADPLLRLSRPQVGDEKPLYYLIAGSLLRLVNASDVVTGMYVGRIVSVILFATAVGVSVLATRRLFPLSHFMQTVPPAFLLFLPMLGEMGSAVSSDAMGVLAGTTFFTSLIPVFRDGLTWKRGGVTMAALTLALLSKKTSLFLLPTVLLALLIYIWKRRRRQLQWGKLTLTGSAILLILIGTILALVPGNDASGWIEWKENCGATRFEGNAHEGNAALGIGPCADEIVSQVLMPETVTAVAGQQINLTGWTRGATGPATGQVSIWDSEGGSQVKVTAGTDWEHFAITHKVNENALWIAVRLTWGGAGETILFDDLTLSANDGKNLLTNGSAEQTENLLLDLLSNTARRVGAPRRLAERILSPQSWSLTAWKQYAQGALFCFHSFWGLFGSQALPLPQAWYWIAELICAAALVGNVILIIKKPGQSWQQSILFTLMGSLILLALQTLLPMIVNRGTYWLPQGRYLFPGISAIAVCISWGLCHLIPRKLERLAIPLAIGGLALFDSLCLGLLIVPYFYTPI